MWFSGRPLLAGAVPARGQMKRQLNGQMALNAGIAHDASLAALEDVRRTVKPVQSYIRDSGVPSGYKGAHTIIGRTEPSDMSQQRPDLGQAPNVCLLMVTRRACL